MSDEYSLYEAKANFSKIVKRVRETGHSVVVTVHGTPAVEIRAYKELPAGLDARLDGMRRRGEIRPATRSPRDYVLRVRTVSRPGGLKRFLDERADDG